MANTARGRAECCITCICHDTPPQLPYFIVQHKCTVLLLIYWFCVGGQIASTSNLVWESGFTKMLNKVIEIVVSLLLLPNQLEINDTQVV